MKKNITKILLDVVMAVILVLLYNTHSISLVFHEIAGIFIFGLFIIHCLLNRKWITAITAKFFSKSLAPRVRFGYIINFLMLASFLLILISGICTSQILFPFADSKDSPWRNIHHFFAAISIILIGIHLGLHWKFISNMFKNMIQLPQKLAKALSICLLLVVLVFGVYSIGTSGFTGWLTSPFITEIKGTANSDNSGKLEEKTQENNTSSDALDLEVKSQANSDVNKDTSGSSELDHPVGEKKMEEGSLIAVMSTITTYLSIIGVFTAATYYLDKFLLKWRKRVIN